MYGLDLFSGIGGLTLALSPWVRPVAYCEIDAYARGVLLSRMSEGRLPNAPVWDDVRTLRAQDIPGRLDIIYGGFPCQDISVAGRGKGLDGERSGLFFQIERLVGEIRPSFVFLENVPAIRTRGGDVVVGRLAGLGYDCRWDVVSAAEVGAPHLRKRWFLLAHAGGERLEGLELRKRAREPQPEAQSVSKNELWRVSDRPALRVAHELPRPVDEVRALGNAVVPEQAREAFRRLSGL